MPQIEKIGISFAFLAIILVLAGCGKGADSGKVFVAESGHPDVWASHLGVGSKNFHGTFIKTVPPGPPGQTLFILHCAPCHDNNAAGKIGPNIQTATIPIINGAVQNLPIMRGHAGLTTVEIQNIADYVSSLAENPQPVSGSFAPLLCMQCHGAELDGGIAGVSCFSCHNGPDGSIGHPAGWLASNNPAGFHGRYGRELLSGCTTCHGVTLAGSIVLRSASGFAPSCSSCHNGTIAPVL